MGSIQVDHQAKNPVRHRRNAQRIGDGDITSLLVVDPPFNTFGGVLSLNFDPPIIIDGSNNLSVGVDAPLIIEAGDGNIGLVLGNNTLQIVSGGLEVRLADTSLSATSTGIKINLPGSSGLQVSSGLKVVVDGSTVIINGSGALATGTGAVFPVLASDPATPTDGQAWFNSTTFNPKVQIHKDSGSHSLSGIIPQVIFQTASGQTITTSPSSGQFTAPNFTLPAGILNSVGRTLRVKGAFTYTVAVANSIQLFVIVLNSAVGVGTTAVTASQTINVDIIITTRTTGSSGTIVFYTVTSNSIGGFSFGAIGTATIDLTSAITVAESFSATVPTASDSIKQEYLSIELLG